MPSVSIIVPYYNAEATLERCVKSLAAQTLEDIEVVFVDDCSTDGGKCLLDALLHKFDNLRSRCVHISNSTHYGCATARRLGMQQSTGDYMIHVDADDWVEPNFAYCLYKKAVDTDADVVICSAERILSCHRSSIIIAVQLDNVDDYMCNFLSGKMHNGLWNKLIRSSIIKSNNIYPIDGLVMYEDKMVLVNLFSQHDVKRISTIQQVLYHYNNCANLSITNSIRGRHAEVAAAKTYINWVENHVALNGNRMLAHRLFKIAITALQIRLSEPRQELVLSPNNMTLKEICQSFLSFYYKLLLIFYKLFLY